MFIYQSPISTLRRIYGKIKGKKFKEFCLKVVYLEKRLNEIEAIIDIILENKEYYPNPSTGINGQVIRKTIIRSICDAFSPNFVIETGTFFGLTAGFFSRELGLPVYTCEINPRYYHVSKRLLRNCSSVEQFMLDSREFLRKLGNDSSISSKRPLFYLDAHSHDNLPLREELMVICQSWSSFCVIIDDFKVPWDDGYRYDDYGNNKSLTPDFVSDILIHYNLSMYMPCIPSDQETGKKRGCAILLKKNDRHLIENINSLREYITEI